MASTELSPPVSEQTEQVTSESHDGAPPVTDCLSDGDSSLQSFLKGGGVGVLAHAVASFRTSLCGVHDGSEEKIKAQIGLTDALRLEVEEGAGGDEHLQESLSLAQAAFDAAVGSPIVYPETLRALGEVLLDRTHAKPTAESIQPAVDTFCQLVAVTSDLRPDVLVKALALHAESLLRQWLATHDPNALDSTNSTIDRAMSICTTANVAPDPELLHIFTQARFERWIFRGSMDDMTQAIQIGEQLTSKCLPAHPRLCKYWNMLGVIYIYKQTVSDDISGYDARILHAYSEARKRVTPIHPSWHTYNGNYANFLHDRFLRKANLEDLIEALAIARSVVSRVAATGYKIRNGIAYVSNLAIYLVDSYAQFGNLDLLDDAVRLQVDLLEEHLRLGRKIDIGERYYYLGKSYRTRYNTHGRRTDLENAVSMHQKALCTGLGAYAGYADVSTQLAESLISSFDEYGRFDDLKQAIAVLQTAVEHPRRDFRGSFFSLLGHALMKQGIAAGNAGDVEESIRCQQKALSLFPDAHSERCVAYHRLATAEYRAFVIGQQASALENSITACRHALSLMPQDHPNRAAYLLDHAVSQLAAADISRPEGLTPILGALGEAAMHLQSWPADRYAAAALWARTAHRIRRLNMALDAYRLAISLLSQVAWLGLEDELRVQRLSKQPPDISQDAAACAIELGLYDLAVEIIDGSRSILWNTSQELRTELGRLKEVAPDLARELAQVNAALAFRPAVPSEDPNSQKPEAERRRIHRLASRRTELLHLARSIPGFQLFLLPPSYDALCKVSRQGPVVIIVSSTFRCDALLLQDDKEVTLVSLVNMTHRLVLAQAEALQKSLRLTGDKRGREFLDRILLRILRDLWDQIGKPVWLALDPKFTDRPLPRIWWCPTGAMTMLPIHACGPHNGQDPNMTELVVSSYTPTLSALLRAQATKSSLSAPKPLPRVLVIAQPELLNRTALPCALEEARVLYAMIPSLCTFRIGPEGTVERVKAMLSDHNWLHVSTHGSQNSRKPLESCIALYDGDLKLSDLAQERIPNAEFAFLSACHSARVTETLPDESMHLAAGLMFAGFRSVVATSWAIADKDAPVVTRAFYSHLIRDGKSPEVTETAEALHCAVKQLRESGAPLHRWIPFGA